jgi:hypothetical protein
MSKPKENEAIYVTFLWLPPPLVYAASGRDGPIVGWSLALVARTSILTRDFYYTTMADRTEIISFIEAGLVMDVPVVQCSYQLAVLNGVEAHYALGTSVSC